MYAYEQYNVCKIFALHDYKLYKHTCLVKFVKTYLHSIDVKTGNRGGMLLLGREGTARQFPLDGRGVRVPGDANKQMKMDFDHAHFLEQMCRSYRWLPIVYSVLFRKAWSKPLI